MNTKRGPLGGLIGDAAKNFNAIKDNVNDRSGLTPESLAEYKPIQVPSSDQIKQKTISFQSQSPQRVPESHESFVKWFSELNHKDVKIAGGKGASLSEMYNAKFPVPPGFMITAQSFDYFLTKTNVKEKIKDIIKKVDLENTEELTNVSKEIRLIIDNLTLPENLQQEILEAYSILSTEKVNSHVSSNAMQILKNSREPAFVSVRSSATTEDLVDASFAGQQETFLNVKGERNLIENVKRCFSSLYTPRAIYYRARKGFTEDQALLAVVVQKMIDSEKSGVVFSKDPMNASDNIILEAVFGLGEGIVSGMINPDHYAVSADLEIKSVKVSEKKVAIVRDSSGRNEIVRLNQAKATRQVMSQAEILDVAHYALRLEKHYEKPQDIEFAIEGGKTYIIQSRPITTIGKKLEANKLLAGNVLLEGRSASPGIGVGPVKIIHSMADLPKIKKGDVLVTQMTNPDMVVAMQKSSAIVTDEGGMTSHAAIVSREMGIPCIVGTDKATKILTNGMMITVDGSSGKVYEGEVSESKAVEIKQAVETERIKLKVIVDLPDFAERAALSGIKHVGLTRLEGIIASMKKHPLQYERENNLDEYSKNIYDGIKKIAFFFESMWIRASDIRTDEYSSLTGSPEKEINPMLGFHGIRFSLKHPGILKAELEAIKKVAIENPKKKFGIMFPQVITIEEVKEAKKYFDEVKTENMEFGVMIETPAAVQIIESIADEVNFISFGTNDLTQFTLAVDRNNEDVQYLYNELHPAIFSQINKVIHTCRIKKVLTSICGQGGSKKEMVEYLFRKGINSISVNADAAYDVSMLIKNLEDEWKRKKEEEIKMKEENLNQIKNNQQIQWNKKGNINLNPQNNNNNNNFQLNKQNLVNNGQNLQSNQNISNSPQGILSNKQISAEKLGAEVQEFEENIGPVEPFNNLGRIEKVAEQIHQNVEMHNEEDVEKMHEYEASIKVDDEIISENSVDADIPAVHETEHSKPHAHQTKESIDDEIARDKKMLDEIDHILENTKDFEEIDTYDPDNRS
ncbi:phosphoenolpyruvate synthase [Candidatus Pacearchaeota archaeon]|nr:phosphoenolpyruvate synthase [Candidatus Pacearchaeota archaeon]